MKKVLIRLISMICSLAVLLSCSCVVYAQETENTKVITQNDITALDIDENYVITSIDEGYEETEDTSINCNTDNIKIDDIISKSTNVSQLANSSYSGSFKSDKYNAGILGYKYQIKFDWTAKVRNGNYVFNTITNYKITTFTNYLLLALTWESYSYRITKNNFTINTGESSVTCNTNYAFDVRDKTTHNNMTITENNKKTFTMDLLL